jgi:virulence-associated protein VagC
VVKAAAPKRYYYAGGERVPIEEDETRVAVDVRRANEAGLQELTTTMDGPRLPGGVTLAARDSFGAKDVERLRKAGALLSVFRHDQAVMVPLPEIRVEVDDEKQRQAVLDSIESSPHPVEISEQDDARLILRPTSQSGEDAIEVANFLHEKAKPAAASIRFVQFVPRPDTTR